SSPVNASGRMYSEFAVGSPSGTLPRSILASDLISRKFPSRWDPPGWPKTDLLSEHNTTTEASIAGDDPAYSIDAMLTAAAPRYADDLCLDRLSIDTLNPKHSAAVWNFLMPSSASGKVSPWLTVPLDYQRRRYGSAGWLTRELMILGLSWTVDPKPGRVRLTMFTKNRAE
ncbi:MAG: hypothetical protein JWN99_2506, partial [Ilumatobacteraceae bacterium]|nr:hypothetical protein [Ilumatobacteraceae bacterium]